MGGGVSRVRLEDCSTEEAPERLKEIIQKTKTWRVYSEDLEWASMKLRAEDSPITIGRRPESDILLSNRTSSGQHAELVFDTAEKRWQIKDVGSSTGTVLMTGPTCERLEKNKLVPLNHSCAVRLGKCFMTILSDQVVSQMYIECTHGPLKGQSWKIPNGTSILSCGSKSGSDIILPEDVKPCKTDFQIFKYNNWFAISDVSNFALPTGQSDSNNEEDASSANTTKPNTTKDGEDGESGAAAEDQTAKKEAEERRKIKNTNGTYLNEKQLKRREMNFLWQGAEIAIGRVVDPAEYDNKRPKAEMVLKFVVKVKTRS